jgi:hypothetical protein
MRRNLSAVVMGLVVAALSCSSIWAQATAQINGAVKDQTGAVLPGVEITVTQTETGATRTTITNEQGSYVLPGLPVGPYRLQASLPGFREYVQTGIELQVSGSPLINVVLELGQVTDTVEVQANAVMVETRSVGVGRVMENVRILELPLNGRDVTALIGLSGASTGIGNTAPSVAGGLTTGLNYTLDGGNHNNPFDNTSLNVPFPDALQEFKVETSATSAQTGIRPAGSVQMVTKSGTNELHGDMFEFVRNGIFNARNAFALTRDSLKRNQFGGTIGGPIAQNKMFFFAGYQGTLIRQDPPERFTFVPTAAMRAGDFTALASPACNRNRQINLGAPFVNNRLDPAQFSKAATALMAKLPVATDPCGRITYSNPSQTNDHMVVGRIDYQWRPNQAVFGRYLSEFKHLPSPYSMNHNLLSVGTENDNKDHQFTVGLTSTYGPNLVNAIRLSANRFGGNGNKHDSFFSWASLGVKTYSFVPDSLSLSITGGFSLEAKTGVTRGALFAINDDVSMVRGNHQVAVGVSTAAWWTNRFSAYYALNRAEFNGGKTGLGLPDFMTGQASLWASGGPASHHKRSKYIGLYAADAWKVNQNLTLQLGLRWEPFFPMIQVDGSATHFDEAAMRRGIRSKQFDNSPAGLFFIGDDGFPGQSGMKNQWMDISPRLGVAWDVTGDGRTSVRASVGTFYDFPSTDYQVGLATVAPWAGRIVVNDTKLDDPWANYPGGDPYPLPFGKYVPRNVAFPAFNIETTMDYDTPSPMTTHWNLAIERQIRNWMLSGSYLGNVTRHLYGTQPLNHPGYIPGGPCTLNGVTYNPCSTTANIDQRRRFMLDKSIPLQTAQLYGPLNKIEAGGTANYNGLVLSVQRRAGGLTTSANYTWSHCISDWWYNTANSGTGTQTWLNPNNRNYDRGNCDVGREDRRHVFNFTNVIATPAFSNPTLRVVGSGWRLSTIFRVMSGAYMTVLSGVDRELTGTRNQRPNQVLANVYGDKTIGNYFNPAAFAQPALGTLGNLGRASITGPGAWQFDAAVTRTFQLRETQKLEFRAEAFNVTNGFRMNDPNLTLSSATFGQVTSARDPRIMQFALKYLF